MLNAGDLNCKVDVEQIKGSVAVNAHGEIDKSDDDNWRVYCVRWIQLLDAGTREVWRARQNDAAITHIGRTRWDNVTRLITRDMRIKLGTSKLEIKTVRDVNQRHEVVELELAERL